MSWTPEDWERARHKFRATVATRDAAAQALGSLAPEVRDRISDQVGAPGTELVRRAQALGGSPTLPGDPDDERGARIAMENCQRFLEQFRTVDDIIRRDVFENDRAALEAAGWRNARDLARAAAGRPEEQVPITVTGRRTRKTLWPLLLVGAVLVLSRNRR